MKMEGSECCKQTAKYGSPSHHTCLCIHFNMAAHHIVKICNGSMMAVLSKQWTIIWYDILWHTPNEHI